MDNELEFIKNSLANFENKLDTLKSDFTKSFGKIELLLEKLANFEQRTDESNKRIHKRIDSVEHRVSNVEQLQNSRGCNALTSFIARREEQLKHYDSIIKDHNARIKENQQALKELQDIPNKVMFRVIVSLITAGIIGVTAYYFADHEYKKVEREYRILEHETNR